MKANGNERVPQCMRRNFLHNHPHATRMPHSSEQGLADTANVQSGVASIVFGSLSMGVGSSGGDPRFIVNGSKT